MAQFYTLIKLLVAFPHRTASSLMIRALFHALNAEKNFKVKAFCTETFTHQVIPFWLQYTFKFNVNQDHF